MTASVPVVSGGGGAAAPPRILETRPRCSSAATRPGHEPAPVADRRDSRVSGIRPDHPSGPREVTRSPAPPGCQPGSGPIVGRGSSPLVPPAGPGSLVRHDGRRRVVAQRDEDDPLLLDLTLLVGLRPPDRLGVELGVGPGQVGEDLLHVPHPAVGQLTVVARCCRSWRPCRAG